MRLVRNLIYYVFYFLPWWYLDNLKFWYKFITRTVLLTANGLAISSMFKNLFKPYRAVRSWVAYVMGFLIRTTWILVSLVLSLGILGVLGICFVLYLILPLMTVFWLGHAPDRILGLGALGILGILYAKVYVFSPKKEGQLTPAAEKIWQKIEKLPYSANLLLTLTNENPRMQIIFQRLNLDPKVLLKKVEGEEGEEGLEGRNWRDLLALAQELRQDLQHKYLDADLLFLALIKLDKKVRHALSSLELQFEDAVETVRWVESKERARQSWKFWRDEYFHLWGGPDRAWVAGFLPNLKHFSSDITKMVSQGRIPYTIQRQKEVEEVLAVLNRTTQNNVILVGPPGVGKTSLVYSIAQELIRGEIAGKLKDKKVLSLDIGGMLAGAAQRGDLEARIQAALSEIQTGKVILFIDEIENLMKAGFEYFLPSLTAGEIQLIGAATPEGFKKYIESSSAFVAQFQVVKIPEPANEEVYPILEAVANRIEQEQGVLITFPAIEEAVKLTRRFIHDRVLPDKAIDLLDEVAVWVTKNQKSKIKNQKLTVTPEGVAKVLSMKIGIPLEKITQGESDKLLHLEKILHQRVIGQDEAITAIANALRRARAGLALGQRPIASFLFIGPTGVGKTETAKTLASVYFGSEEGMVRLDMSEYTEKHNLTRLIGAAPGFAGFEEGGQLTEAVRARPFTVILADEFEKAHPAVLNLFLQIMDEGRLTDGAGRTADFSNTMIIATSNAFSERIYEWIREGEEGREGIEGKGYEKLKTDLLSNLQKVFAPELLNRFDDIIVFKPLTFEEQISITRLLLQEVADKLKEKEIEIVFNDDLVKKLVEMGIDVKFGARPLRRVIQEKVENPLAEKILLGKLKAGDKMEAGVEILGN